MEKEILKSAYRAWSAAGDLRRRRARYKRYTYGDQWSDLVRDSRGRLVTERDQLTASGKRPMINNLIRQLVKTIVGRYRTQAAEAGRYDDEVSKRNNLAELDSRLLEEFLISGTAVQRISREERFGSEATWVDNVDMRKFFVNRFRDPRGWDIKLVGQLHDLTFPEVARRFAGGSRRKAESLRKLFASIDRGGSFAAEPLGEPGGNVDFFCPEEAGLCRVAEVWTLDSCRKTDRKNPDSLTIETGWHCRWMAPDGTLLADYPSPYRHGSHPYAVKFYPLTDGEVHSFVEDIIDQQRSINRLIVLIDKIMATSAKGVLLFPADQKTDNMTWEQITERWAQSDGVIPISGRGDHLPQQVMTNPGASGAYQFLQLQMKLFDDISGVGDALLGRSSITAKGAEMLESQLRNATIALADIFDTFIAFTEERAKKL